MTNVKQSAAWRMTLTTDRVAVDFLSIISSDLPTVTASWRVVVVDWLADKREDKSFIDDDLFLVNGEGAWQL